jgi:hypothetical protein
MFVATAQNPQTIGDMQSAVLAMFTRLAPDVGLALIAIAGATVVLAIGRNLLLRVWYALSGLGSSSGLSDFTLPETFEDDLLDGASYGGGSEGPEDLDGRWGRLYGDGFS